MEQVGTEVFEIGDKVAVTGKLYGNGHGTGSAVTKEDATMYVVSLVDPERYPYYIGVANTRDGVRQGWVSPKSLMKLAKAPDGVIIGEVKSDIAPTSGQSGLAGSYTTNTRLHIRRGAGSHNQSMAVLPMGHLVECKKGHYTLFQGTKWLYVETVYRNVRYEGYCSGHYLLKVKR